MLVSAGSVSGDACLFTSIYPVKTERANRMTQEVDRPVTVLIQHDIEVVYNIKPPVT